MPRIVGVEAVSDELVAGTRPVIGLGRRPAHAQDAYRVAGEHTLTEHGAVSVTVAALGRGTSTGFGLAPMRLAS